MRILHNMNMVQKICIISISCLTIPTLFFSFYLYQKQSRDFYEQLIEEQSITIEQLTNSVDSRLYSINNLSLEMAYSEPINSYLARQHRIDLEKYPIWAEKQLNEIISSIKYSLKYHNLGINTANIFTTHESAQEGDYFWKASRLNNLKFFQDFSASNLSSAMIYLNQENTEQFRNVCGYTSTSAEKDILLMIQKINSSYFESCIGYLVFECSPSKIFSSPFSSQNGNYFAWFQNIQNAYGNTPIMNLQTLTLNDAKTSAFITNLGEHQHIGCAMKHFDIIVVSTQPLTTDTYKLTSYSVSLLLATFALIQLIILTLFIRRTFDHLHKDLNLMDSIIAHGFKERIPEVRTDEIGIIAHHYNILLDKINSLIQETVQKETEQTHAQLKALQYQINPHFIYNTLSVFSGYASQNGQETLAESIASFGQILRYNIKNDSLYATIDSELRCATSLINIYNIRYFNQIQLNIDVSTALRQYQIIKFLLQPLLENSILHGLNHISSSLEIYISIQKTNDFLIIQVSDNGKGMSSERLQKVQNYMLNPSEELPDSSNGSFIGLQNIYKRLKLFYGQNAQMTIDSEEDCGTLITLQIPTTALTNCQTNESR